MRLGQNLFRDHARIRWKTDAQRYIKSVIDDMQA
jgi:hypothetical protein